MATPTSFTTWKQKFFLIFGGLFLTFVLLEIGLRLGAWVILSLQDQSNHATFENNEVRILTVGDSMTALGGQNSYPRQLEDILNSQSDSKYHFKVINKGIISSTSSLVLENLRVNLKEYKPAIVICMIGVNDRNDKNAGSQISLTLRNWLNHSQCYKLFRFMKMHLQSKIALSNPNSETNFVLPQDLVQPLPPEEDIFRQSMKVINFLRQRIRQLEPMREKEKNPQQIQQIEKSLAETYRALVIRLIATAHEYRIRENYVQARHLIDAGLSLDPKFYLGYVELGRCYKEQKEYNKAVTAFNFAIGINPKPLLAQMELASTLDAMNQHKEALAIYDSIYEKNTKNLNIDSDIAEAYAKDNSLAKAQIILEKAIRETPRDHTLYTELSKLYQQEGNDEKAQYYKKKAQVVKLGVDNPLQITIYNYNEIANLVAAHNAVFVAMQYPLRDLSFLQGIFSNSNKIIFVENQENFANALRKAMYLEYFDDAFGVDFGHCTRKGNRLIAISAAKAIRGFFKIDQKPMILTEN